MVTYVFHNGGKDIRGIPFLKFSCINETIAFGARPRLKIDKDLQIATITGWTDSFMKGTPLIGKTKDLNSCGIKSLLEDFDVTHYAIMPIYEDSLLTGFVAVEWKLDKYVPVDKKFIESDVIQCAKILEVNSIKDINHFLLERGTV